MTKKLFCKEDLYDILNDLNYFDNFKKKYLNNKFNRINYGKRIGELSFDNLFDAAAKYTYSNKLPESIFKDWNRLLDDENSTEEDLFCVILEIFVWGDVLSGNVKTAINLYKKKELKGYITQMKEQLKKNEILNKGEIESEIIWSSGWTKVYSFINNDILIYDSRVSAFLNHTLTYDIEYTDDQFKKLKELTTHLFNFQGAENRERLVDKNRFGFKNRSPNGINGFNANLISSWTADLLKKEFEVENGIRDFERAFFMLGFDLKQIKPQNFG
jgi:hypothetical protein